VIAANQFETSALPPPELPQAPYRGIEAFRFIDAPIFCSREQEIRKLIRYTTIYRGVLLYGASGVGKSSLINAGLLPELRKESYCSERIRVQPRRGEELIIERIPLTRDGRAPYLPSVFVPEERWDTEGHRSPVSDAEAEARIVLAVDDFLAILRRRAPRQPVLLIFDQFEEFVTLFEEAPQIQSLHEAREAQKAILDALVALLRDPSLPVKLLFAFREDYLARLTMLFRRCPDLTDQYLRLTSPDKASLLDIVLGPFRSEIARGHFGRELSDNIAQELAAEIDKRGEDLLNLSEVEIVCDRLWHSDDPTQLLKKRGIQGLLEDYLADELLQLQDLRDPAVALLSRMVTSGGTRNVISEADLIPQVHKEERLPEESLKRALVVLEKDTRLVRRELRNRVYFYEIVSEFLVPWIYRQKELREAMRERRTFRRRVFGIAALICLLSIAIVVWERQALSKERVWRNFRAVEADLDVQGKLLERTNQKLDDTVRELSRQRGESSNLVARLSVAEKLRDQWQKTAALGDEKVRQLSVQLQQADQVKAQLNADISGLKERLLSLQSSLTETMGRATTAEGRISELGKKLADEEQQINQLNAALQAKVDENKQLQKQVEQLTAASKTAQDRASSLEKRLADQVRQSDQLQKQIDQLMAARGAAQEDFQRLDLSLSQERASWQAEKEKLEADRKQALASAEKVRKELNACQEQVAPKPSPPP
jgi:uncharacterized coiled-coil protein SlyX